MPDCKTHLSPPRRAGYHRSIQVPPMGHWYPSDGPFTRGELVLYLVSNGGTPEREWLIPLRIIEGVL